MNIKDYLLREKRLKILSFVLALALWVVVHHGTEKEAVLPAKVRIAKLKDGIILKKVSNDTVNIVVKGRPSSLKEVEDLLVLLDLSAYDRGTYMIRITKEHITMPGGIRVKAIKPSFVRVELEAG